MISKVASASSVQAPIFIQFSNMFSIADDRVDLVLLLSEQSAKIDQLSQKQRLMEQQIETLVANEYRRNLMQKAPSGFSCDAESRLHHMESHIKTLERRIDDLQLDLNNKHQELQLLRAQQDTAESHAKEVLVKVSQVVDHLDQKEDVKDVDAVKLLQQQLNLFMLQMACFVKKLNISAWGGNDVGGFEAIDHFGLLPLLRKLEAARSMQDWKLTDQERAFMNSLPFIPMKLGQWAFRKSGTFVPNYPGIGSYQGNGAAQNAEFCTDLVSNQDALAAKQQMLFVTHGMKNATKDIMEPAKEQRIVEMATQRYDAFWKAVSSFNNLCFDRVALESV